MADINFGIIILAALVAVASPGPATLAIANTSMSLGRKQGAIVALGITTGSLIWSLSAAFGVSALMVAEAWIMTWVRYCGAAYLIFMAWQSAKSSLKKPSFSGQKVVADRHWTSHYL